jgi:hypothetical protein
VAKDDPTKSVTIPVSVQGATSPTIYGIDVRNHVFLPGSKAQVVPYFYSGGSTATLDQGIGGAVSGTTYAVQPTSLTQYLLTLKITSQTSITQLSDWVAPGIAAFATADVALTSSTAFNQREPGNSLVIRPDGKIVIAGGGEIYPENYHYKEDSYLVAIPDERICDPSNGQLVSIKTGVVRANHAAVALGNGEVRYFGGTPRDAVRFDPSINRFGSGGSDVSYAEGLRNRYRGGLATQMLDGKVVVIGGTGAWMEWESPAHDWFYMNERTGPTKWVEIKNLSSGSIDYFQMIYPRSGGTAILLRDGRVFVAGGGGAFPNQDPSIVEEQPEILNLSTKTSTLTTGFKGFWDARNSVAISVVSGAALMTDGKVLIIEKPTTGGAWLGIWDPVTDSYIRVLKVPSPIENLCLKEPIGDGLFVIGSTTRVNPISLARESYVFFYDSVKNIVISSENLNVSSGQDLLSSIRWIGMTAQGDVLAGARYGSDNSEQLVRIRLSIPVLAFPSSASLPTGAILKLSAWSSKGEPISWSVLEGGAGGTISADGAYHAPSVPGIYHAVATTASGRAIISLKAVPVPPYVASIQADPPNGTGGSTITVRWDAQWADAMHLQMRDGNGSLLQDLDVTGTTMASIVVTPTTRSFAIVASNLSGTSEASVPFTQWEVYRVNINPGGTQNMIAGTGRSFTASVDGSPGTPGGVAWSSVPVGAVTSEGVFTAPAAAGTYSVTATSVFAPSKSTTNGIYVGFPPAIASFTANPVLVGPGMPVLFEWQASDATYQVISIPQDQYGAGGQSWNVTGLSQCTLYPTRTAMYTLSASNFFGGSSKDVQVVVSPVTAIAITPMKATAFTGSTMNFGSSITSAGNTAVTWSTDDPRGSLSSSGLSAAYTPGTTPGTYHVTVTSVLDPTRSATAEVTVIQPQVTLSITPSGSALVTGQSLSLGSSIQVTGGSDTRIIWSCSGGALLSKGPAAFYTAPLVPGAYTVTVTSVANPDLSATSTIQVSAPSSSTPTLMILPQAATIQPGQRLYLGVDYATTDPSLGLDWAATGGNLAPDGRNLYGHDHQSGRNLPHVPPH